MSIRSRISFLIGSLSLFSLLTAGLLFATASSTQAASFKPLETTNQTAMVDGKLHYSFIPMVNNQSEAVKRRRTPTPTAVIPMGTQIPVQATATAPQPVATQSGPTAVPVQPTATQSAPTAVPIQPTATKPAPTATPVQPTATVNPSPTPTATGTRNFYISTTGSDSNPGTSAAPWRTIQKAANTLVAGDTAIIMAGTYTEDIRQTASGIAGKPITFMVNTGDQVKIIGTFTIAGNYVVLDGKNSLVVSATTLTWAWSGTVNIAGSNDLVQNLQVRDSTRIGISLDQATNNNVIQNNVVSQANCDGIFIRGQNQKVLNNEVTNIPDCYKAVACGGYPDNNAIYVVGTNHVVRGNYLHDMATPTCGGHTDIIQTSSQGANANERAVSGLTFENNRVRHYIPGMFTFMFESTDANYPVENVTIRNNLFQVAQGYCTDSPYYLRNLYVYNNTWIGNPNQTGNWPRPWSINGASNKSNIFFRNNITVDYKGNGNHGYLEVGTSDYQLAWNSDGSTPAGTQPVHKLWGANPLFGNFVAGPTAGGDYHLRSGSPAIDQGTQLTDVTSDFDGTPRPQGMGWDLGAFEAR